MNNEQAGPRVALRRSVYVLLMVTSAATMVGRIMAVRSDNRATPFLSANDRSRWSTIRALLDQGTFAIDEVRQDKNWDTIDKVRHAGRDGRPHFYSSKPTLLTTLLAGECYVVQAITGTTLKKHPFYVGRLMLVITNVLPLILYFALLVRIVERWGKTDWGRIYVMVVATWGTYLTAFAVTLNNHVPAAVCVLIAIYAALRIWYDGERRWRYFAIVGFFAALATANELPALALLAMLGCGLLYQAARPTLWAFMPAAALVVAGFFGTNYAAHGSFQTRTTAAPIDADEVTPGHDVSYHQDAAEGTPIEVPPGMAAAVVTQQQEKKTSWIDIELVYEDGEPVPGEPYEVVASDGVVKRGKTDVNGRAHVTGIAPGTCQITFTRRDKREWKRA